MSKNLNNSGAEVESDATRIRKRHDGNQKAARWKSGSGTIGIGCGNWLREAEIEDCGAGKRRNLEEIFGES